MALNLVVFKNEKEKEKYLENIWKLFQKYFKNILKIFWKYFENIIENYKIVVIVK